MYDTLVDKLSILDEKVTKNYPNLQYEGTVDTDEDEMDYVTIEMKGVVIA